MNIPSQLQNPEFRFCLINKQTKIPFEKKWQNNGYKFDDSKLLQHIENGGNYGVIGGYGNLRILDKDSDDLNIDLDTFCVQTGSGGKHFYFLSDYQTNHVFNNNMGELRAKNYQVVGPNSIHPNGQTYKVHKDLSIKEIPSDKIKELIKLYIRNTEDTNKDTSRSGVEWANVLKYMNKGMGDDEINKLMLAFSKWKEAPEAYRRHTLAEARKVYNTEQKEPKKPRRKLSDIFTRQTQADEYGKLQPYFYDSSNIFWLWSNDDYCWKRIDDVDVLNMVSDMTQRDIITSKIRQEILNALKQQGRRHIPKEPKKTWIQFKDIIIDVMTGKQFKATPEWFMTNPLPWKLGKSEDTPILDKLLHDWVVTRDKQDETYVKTLYEIISYLTLTDYPIHSIFCFTGEGMNGKGSFLRVCEKFISKENSISSDWDLLTQSNFETSTFYKKLLCCMGDIDKGIFKKTKWIKRLTGQDTIPMQFKHKARFDGKNYAKILVATNSIPETSDKSNGFYRRWCIIDFFNTFSDRGIDITETIPTVEFENLARKCINILKELLITGKFTNQGTIEERKKKYEEHTNCIEDFINEYCDENLLEDILFSDFWYQYNSWLKSNGLNVQSKPEVSKQLSQRNYLIKKKNIIKRHSNGDEYPSSEIAVFGIKWRYEEESEPELL